MKIAVIGSRGLTVSNLEKYLPKETTEIVSGGAVGIDTCAKEYAIKNNIKLIEFLPEYEKYGRSAPLRRNLSIIDYADCVIAFWDGTKLFPTTPQSPAVTAPLTRGALKQPNQKIKPVVIGLTDSNGLYLFLIFHYI